MRAGLTEEQTKHSQRRLKEIMEEEDRKDKKNEGADSV